VILYLEPVEWSFNRWLESLIYYGGWGAREATYTIPPLAHITVGRISIPSAQAWTPSILTEPHNSLNDALAPLDRTKPLHLLLCWQ
jgi:hypothetical protein